MVGTPHWRVLAIAFVMYGLILNSAAAQTGGAKSKPRSKFGGVNVKALDDRALEMQKGLLKDASEISKGYEDAGETAVFAVRELNEDEQLEALYLRARLRGFELPPETARYLQRRYPRDMRSLCEVLDTLDDAAFAAQRRITVPFIRDIVEKKA